VKVKRKLRRVGNSVMVPIPPEALGESGLKVGQEVVVRVRYGQIELVPSEGPGADVAAFAARFVDRYRDALSCLAQ
jgi:antitoxin component of MazEF toxin-antitoxin module